MDTRYLCIGHCCHDKVGDEIRLGGTVSYAALIANAWQKEVTLATSVGPDFQFAGQLKEKGIHFINTPSDKTTTFINTYSGEQRMQQMPARANSFASSFYLSEWATFPIVHLGPIADEIDLNDLHHLKNSLVGLSLQGKLRKWDNNGIISPNKELDFPSLALVDIVFLSDEDIMGIEDILPRIKESCSHVVVTKGSQGADVHFNGKTTHYKAQDALLLDPTGAGDAFATAYLIAYKETGKVSDACLFAHSAASLMIESQGVDNIPTLEEVRKRMSNI